MSEDLRARLGVKPTSSFITIEQSLKSVPWNFPARLLHFPGNFWKEYIGLAGYWTPMAVMMRPIRSFIIVGYILNGTNTSRLTFLDQSTEELH